MTQQKIDVTTTSNAAPDEGNTLPSKAPALDMTRGGKGVSNYFKPALRTTSSTMTTEIGRAAAAVRSSSQSPEETSRYQKATRSNTDSKYKHRTKSNYNTNAHALHTTVPKQFASYGYQRRAPGIIHYSNKSKDSISYGPSKTFSNNMKRNRHLNQDFDHASGNNRVAGKHEPVKAKNGFYSAFAAATAAVVTKTSESVVEQDNSGCEWGWFVDPEHLFPPGYTSSSCYGMQATATAK